MCTVCFDARNDWNYSTWNLPTILVTFSIQSSFFLNDEFLDQLDELDKLDRITHVWIGFVYSLTQAQKTF